MIYSSIDIGTDTIKFVVMEYIDNKFNILASTNTKTFGIKRGVISDKDLLAKSLIEGNKDIEKQLGFKINKAIITLPCYDSDISLCSGETEVSSVVSGSDISNVLNKIIKENLESDREVITVSPIDFNVDNEEKVLDPKGLKSYKLGCRTLISTMPKELVYSYLEVLNIASIEVIDLCFNTVGDYYTVKKEEYSDNIGAVINIGHSKTEIGIFNKGLLVKNEIYPIGSKQIDHDLKYFYKINSSFARDLKENFSLANKEYAYNDYMEIVNDEKQTILISQREISEIVESRLEEILKNVKKYLKELTNKNVCYIIITGGISNIPGFNSIVDSIFGDITNTVNINILGARDNIYSSAIGIIKYFYDKNVLRGINYSMYDIKDIKNKGILNDYVKDKITKFIINN